jgi:lactate dehydrogenase-like 2-hydroxyacid dehydrogenase
MKPEILIAAIYTPDQLAYYDDAEVAISKVGANVRAVVTVGSQAFTGAMMDAMPKLQIIIIRGAGFEGIDLIAAKARGVIVCNTPSTNYFSVAEHAMALLLSIGRRIPADFTAIQQGKWQEHKSQPVRYLIYNKHIGILGLGAIGAAIAQRAIAFETTVSYHNRSKRLDVPYAYSPSALDLACESDVLIVATPGGPETKHLVSAKVLDALGPKGYLVNVGRGSIVDQNALIDALHDRRIAGAALDVVDGEPEMPQRLLNAPNVIITPHIGGGSTESRLAVIVAVIANLLAGMAGLPVKNQLV